MTALRREPPVPPEVAAAIRAPFAAFGASGGGAWTETSVLQPLSTLLDLAGEAMRARLYVVAGDGAEELALRPDFTIALARDHLASRSGAGRRLYEGEVFRLPPPGADRAGEFPQLGVEVFGSAGDPAALDGEVAALAWAAARAGGRDDLSLHLGDVGLFAAFAEATGLPEGPCARLLAAFAAGRSMEREVERLAAPPAAREGDGRLARLLGELPEGEAAAALEEVWRLAGIQPVGGRGAAEIVHRLAERTQAARAPRLSAAEAELLRGYLRIAGAPLHALDAVRRLAGDGGRRLDAALEAWSRRLAALSAGGAPTETAVLACGLARPFGYYDGALFEVRSAALPADAPVAGGGRYDGLLSRLGGSPAAAVGCAVRPGRAWTGGEA